jgi:CheY-like chemotaxis protein
LAQARVLIVDDLQVNRLVLAAQLHAWKLDCECAASGE